MSLLKNFIKLFEAIPASKPILHQVEEIVLSLQRSSPLAKSKDLRQQVLNAKNQYNREVASIKRAYDPGPGIVTDRFQPMDKIIKDNSSLNKPKPTPQPPGRGINPGNSGINNPGNGGGPILGGGGLDQLWK